MPTNTYEVTNSDGSKIIREQRSEGRTTYITDRDASGNVVAERKISRNSGGGKTLYETKYSSGGGYVLVNDKGEAVASALDPNMSTPEGVAYAPPPSNIVRVSTSSPMDKTGLYAELGEDGKIKDSVYTRDEESGEFKKTSLKLSTQQKSNIESGLTVSGYRYVESGGQTFKVPVTEEARIKEGIKKDAEIENKMKMFGGGEITAAQKPKGFNALIPNFLRESGAAFGQGFKEVGLLEGESQYSKYYRSSQAPGYQTGAYFLGEVSGISFLAFGSELGFEAASELPAAFNLVRASKAGKFVETGYSALKLNPVGEFGIKVSGSLLRGAAIIETAKLAGKFTAPESQKNIMNLPGYSDAISKAYYEEAEANAMDAWYKGVAYTINPGLSSNRGVFDASIRQDLLSRGYSAAQVELAVQAARRQRTFTNVGELGAFLDVSRSSEAYGRLLVGRAFAKEAERGTSIALKTSFSQLFKISAPRIAAAGALEGGNTQILQSLNRQQTLKPVGSVSISEQGVYYAPGVVDQAALGAVSAGLVGGSIVGLSAVKPGASKLVQGLSYISDPLEYPGDKFQDLVESVGRRSGRTYQETNLFINAPAQETISFGGAQKSIKGNVNAALLSFAPTAVNTPSNVNAAVNVNSPVNINNPINVITPVDIFSNVNVPVNANVNSFVDVFSNVNTPVNTQTETNSEVPVNVNTNTNILVNTPSIVNVPLLKIPPPIPLDLGVSPGGSGYGRKKKNVYINELSAGLSLLGGVNGNFDATVKDIMKVGKNNKSSKKRRK